MDGEQQESKKQNQKHSGAGVRRNESGDGGTEVRRYGGEARESVGSQICASPLAPRRKKWNLHLLVMGWRYGTVGHECE